MELNKTPSLVQGSQAKGEPASFAKSAPRPIKWYGSRCWTSKTLDEFMLRVGYFKWTVRITIGAPYPNSRTLKSHSYNLYPKKSAQSCTKSPAPDPAWHQTAHLSVTSHATAYKSLSGRHWSVFLHVLQSQMNRIAESLPSHFWVAKWPKKAQFLKGIGTLRWASVGTIGQGCNTHCFNQIRPSQYGSLLKAGKDWR